MGKRANVAYFVFFHVTRRTYPSANPDSRVSPETLLPEYREMHGRFEFSLVRLRKVTGGSSLGGRGAPLMNIFSEMDGDMKESREHLASGRRDRYIDAVLRLGRGMRKALAVLQKPA